MGIIKRVLFLLVALAAAVIALLAAADNSDEVALQFLDFQSPVLPISWWILMAFVIGVFFGVLLNLVSNTRLRINARRASKNAETRTRELDRARASTQVEAQQG